MGAIGGLLGLGGGSSGTGFNVSSPVTGQQINTAYTGTQGALGNQNALLTALQNQQGLQNQSQVYNQLQGIAAGQGPNPAQAMLNQATGQNVANQAALMAGQRGAASNVGLMARQAAQQGAQIQQQAAGQGATMQANQSLNALGQAGNMANTMASNQIGQTNANQAAQQAQQNALLQAQTSANQQQAGLAQTQMQGQQGLVGGLLGGAGSALGMSGGSSGGGGAGALGLLALMSDGGQVQDQSAYQGQSKFGKALTTMSQDIGQSSGSGGAKALQQGMTQFGAGIGKLLQNKQGQNVLNGNTQNINDQPWNAYGQDMDSTMNAAQGGDVGGKLKSGGHVPGKADIKGDSLKNDTVHAMLSPGEIVIPRSVINSKDPVRGSADFVRSVLAKKGLR